MIVRIAFFLAVVWTIMGMARAQEADAGPLSSAELARASARLAEYRRSEKYYQELFRPRYHFTPEVN